MKNKLLFFDMEFTSLSPDAQLISLGIISDCDKSMYCEFTDFDINRCDDWVKENVILKTEIGFNKSVYPEYKEVPHCLTHEGTGITRCVGNTEKVKKGLLEWLSQFSDYQIQFVCDCGTWDWWFMVQLLDERPLTSSIWLVPDVLVPDGMTGMEFLEQLKKNEHVIYKHNPEMDVELKLIKSHQFGLPKFPDNISPVPFDLNDLIAIKKGITPKEAFDLNREELCEFPKTLDIDISVLKDIDIEEILKHMRSVGSIMVLDTKTTVTEIKPQKHNSLFDAKVIKEIYNKLK